MDTLYRFLGMPLRELQTELQLSEMRKKQVFMLHLDSQYAMRRELLLA
jgi:hypothetical protein